MKMRSSFNGNLVAAIATVTSCDIAFGLTFQLLPLLLHERGVPAWAIGVNAAMGPLGILLAGPILPSTIHKFGARKLAFAALALILVCLAGFASQLPFAAWFLLRFALGLSIGTLFTVSEIWILNASTDANRGRNMGLYSSALSISFAVGPLLVPFTGIEGWAPWLIGMLFVALGVVPLTFVKVSSDGHEKPHGLFTALGRAPLLFAAIATAAIFDNVFISFFTLFGIAKGLPLATASQILGVAIFSGAILFYPLGMLGDRLGRVTTIMACCAIAILTISALIPLTSTALAWPLTIIAVTAAFGVYVLAIAIIGDVFKGPDVVAGAAGVAAMWGIGGLTGPPITGAAIDAFGINALPVSLAILYGLLLLGLGLKRGKLA